jgi:hypothetical protein
MNKLKRKIHSFGLRLGWRFYKWNTEKYWEQEDKLWNPLGEKKTNTDRIISNMKSNEEFSEQVAELFDVPAHMIHSQGHNHRKEKK